MYSNSDIYLFDDPISALDIHVGKYVMEEGILGFLAGKTRIVATHALAYLKLFDYIYVLDDGEIVEHGDFDTLKETEIFKEIQASINKLREEEDKKRQEQEEKKLKEQAEKESNKNPLDDIIPEESEPDPEEEKLTEDGEKRESLLSQTQARSKNNSVVEMNPLAPGESEDGQKNVQKKLIQDIIQAEDKSKGAVSFSVVKKWISMQGGSPLVFFLLVTMTVWSVTKAGVPWFLQYWSSHQEEFDGDKNKDLREFLGLYMSLNVISISCDFIRTNLVFRGNLRLSRELNFMMTFKLMHASINKFFDRVPLGRILNRFLKDVQVVDSSLGWSTAFLTAIL